MAQTQMLEKYHFEDKFMYIDLKAVKKLSDIETMPFQGQRQTFTVLIPAGLRKEIASAKFTSEQAYLLVATEAITSYRNAQAIWSVAPEFKDAFTWMLVNGEKMTLQPLA